MEKTEPAAEAIAHEINNVLMALSLSVEMLDEHCVPSNKTRHLLQIARECIERCVNLNQQLLNIASSHCSCKTSDDP